jgi:hypothetical protein
LCLAKNEEKLGHLNFASQLLPSLNINAQNKVPLNKFLVFEKKFSGKILIIAVKLILFLSSL